MKGDPRDRIAGALLALAADDALGAGCEFTDPDLDADISMIGGGPFGVTPSARGHG